MTKLLLYLPIFVLSWMWASFPVYVILPLVNSELAPAPAKNEEFVQSVYRAKETVCGTISTDMTWTLANSPYQLTCDLTVSSGVTLTVESGVKIEIPSSRSLDVDGLLLVSQDVEVQLGQYTEIDIRGTLTAQGTASQPITFTQTTGGQYWDSVSLYNGSQTTLNYVHFEGGGSYGFGAITAYPNAILDAQNLTMQNNKDGNNAINLYNSSSVGQTVDQVWEDAGVPYRIKYSYYGYKVSSGSSLTINPNVIVELEAGASLGVSGVLTAVGEISQPITFTQTVAGQYWAELELLSGSEATLEHVYFEGGGSQGNGPVKANPNALLAVGNLAMQNNQDGNNAINLYNSSSVGQTVDQIWEDAGVPYRIQYSYYDYKVSSGSSLTINPNVIVELEAGASLGVSGVLTAVGEISQPITFTQTVAGQYWAELELLSGSEATLEHVYFEGGGSQGNGPVKANPNALLAVGNLAMQNNQDGNNAINLYNSSSVGQTVDQAWEDAGVPYRIQYSYYDYKVSSGSSLTINPNVIVELEAGASLGVSGVLTAVGEISQPITFTQTVAGQYWAELELLSGSEATLEHVYFEGGGSQGNGPVKANPNALLAVGNLAMQNNQDGNNAINLYNSSSVGQTVDQAWEDAGVPYRIRNSYYDYKVSSGSSLTINPNVIVELEAGANLEVSGVLTASGLLTSGITFKPADSNSHWGTLTFITDSIGSLQHVTLTHGGYTNTETLLSFTKDLTLTYGTIEFSGGDAIGVMTDSTPYFSNLNIVEAGGTGIQVVSANPTVKNSILYSNRRYGIECVNSPSVTIEYNDFWANLIDSESGCDLGIGNIEADPLFKDFAGGDYDLFWSSPCVNAGDPVLVDSGSDSRLDIGRYPYIYPSRSSVQMSLAEFSISEGTPSAILSVELTNPVTRTVSVDYIVEAVTATPYVDYIPISGTLTFSPGSWLKTIELPLIDDVADEYDEVVKVELRNPVFLGLNSPISTSLTIRDNDPLPTLAVTSTQAHEGQYGANTAVVSMTIVGVTDRIVSVKYGTLEGTALAGIDYESTHGKLTFSPSESLQTIEVLSYDDDVDENDETLFLAFSDVTNASLSVNKLELYIVDDDPYPRVGFQDVTYEVEESENAIISVTLTAVSERPILVDYVGGEGFFIQNSANPNDDFVVVRGTLVFTPGVLVSSFTVPVIGDEVDEYNEHIALELRNAVRAEIFNPYATAIIVDDDPYPSLSIRDISLKEENSGTTTADFLVELSTISGREVELNYRSEDDTATAGVDYTPVSGSLVFNPESITRTVSVDVIGDEVFEQDEVFNIVLAVCRRGNRFCEISTEYESVWAQNRSHSTQTACFSTKMMVNERQEAVWGRVEAWLMLCEWHASA